VNWNGNELLKIRSGEVKVKKDFQGLAMAAVRAWRGQEGPEGRGAGLGKEEGDAWSGQELEVAPGTA
jgi:hypothetical protein